MIYDLTLHNSDHFMATEENNCSCLTYFKTKKEKNELNMCFSARRIFSSPIRNMANSQVYLLLTHHVNSHNECAISFLRNFKKMFLQYIMQVGVQNMCHYQKVTQHVTAPFRETTSGEGYTCQRHAVVEHLVTRGRVSTAGMVAMVTCGTHFKRYYCTLMWIYLYLKALQKSPVAFLV